MATVSIVFDADDVKDPSHSDYWLRRGEVIDSHHTSVLVAWVGEDGMAQFVATGDFEKVRGEQIDHLVSRS